MVYGIRYSKPAIGRGEGKRKMENMKIEFNREEAEALMDCVAVTKNSRDYGALTISEVEEFRLKQVNLDNLWIKIFGAHEKKFMQIPQTKDEKSARS